jgi:hypothetical protein
MLLFKMFWRAFENGDVELLAMEFVVSFLYVLFWMTDTSDNIKRPFSWQFLTWSESLRSIFQMSAHLKVVLVCPTLEMGMKNKKSYSRKLICLISVRLWTLGGLLIFYSFKSHIHSDLTVRPELSLSNCTLFIAPA